MKARIRNIVKDAVRKLEIENGDVILIKQGTPLGEHQNFHSFVQMIGKTGREKCIGVIVDDFDDLSVLNKEDMRAFGWEYVGTEE